MSAAQGAGEFFASATEPPHLHDLEQQALELGQRGNLAKLQHQRRIEPPQIDALRARAACCACRG